jgi:hypothetical protein
LISDFFHRYSFERRLFSSKSLSTFFSCLFLIKLFIKYCRMDNSLKNICSNFDEKKVSYYLKQIALILNF